MLILLFFFFCPSLGIVSFESRTICPTFNNTHCASKSSFYEVVRTFEEQPNIVVNPYEQRVYTHKEVLTKDVVGYTAVSGAYAYGHGGLTSWSKYSNWGERNTKYLYSTYVECVIVSYSVTDPSVPVDAPDFSGIEMVPFLVIEKHPVEEDVESFSTTPIPNFFTVFILVIISLM